MGGGTFKNWDTHLAKATWLVNTRGSTNWAGPAQSKPQRPVEGDKVPVVHMSNILKKDGLLDENLADHSDDETGPGFQQLAPSNFLEIDVSNLQTVGTGHTGYISRELWMQQVTAHHYTSPLLPWKTITTDGAQSHGLNELNGHFRVMIHRLRERYLETGEVVVINWTMGDLGMM